MGICNSDTFKNSLESAFEYLKTNISKKTIMGRPKIYFIILILLSAACSKSEEMNIPEEIAEHENLSVFPTDSEPAFDITFDRQTVFGDTEDVLLGSRLMITVDDRGRVYIADNQEIALHVYNPDGSYIRQIGQEGDGPGEYRMIRGMQTDGNSLHLLDLNLSRITRYNLDDFKVEGDLSLTVDRGNNNGIIRYPQAFYVLGKDIYLLQLGSSTTPGPSNEDAERTIEGRKVNYITSEIVDSTFFSFPSSERLMNRSENAIMVMSVPYNRRSVISVNNGQVIYGWSEDFFLKVYDDSGQYQRAIYYPFENIPLDRNEVLEIYSDHDEQWQDMVRGNDMPETWPVFESFTVDDDGRIWVEKLTENRDESEYVVLANSGELLATFNWPSDKEFQEIKNGYLYALETDEETGLREVVKYGISFDEK